MTKKNRVLGGFVVLLAAGSALADAPATTGCTDAQRGATSVTQHQITVNGQMLSYSATVGYLEVTFDPSLYAGAFPGVTNSSSPSSSQKACFFYTAYQVATAPGAPQRPLTFAFNGGPGSASLWLHLGIGPVRVNMGADGTQPPLPFQLQSNPDTPLDLTDIVFIDPVGTGFSSAEGPSTNESFFGAYNDAESVATFIRTYMDEMKREDSPLYIMGESYGGMRGSLLAQLLELPLYLPLKGVIFVSPCLSSTIYNFGEDDNDVPYYTFFPTFATTSWYQKTAAPKYLAMNVGDVYKAARDFAFGPYRDALAQGNNLDPKDPVFQMVAEQISEFTGIPVAQVSDRFLRLRDVDYFGMELESKNEIVGRFDTRFVGPKLVNQDGSNATDPSDVDTGYPYVSAVNSYIRNDLGFATSSPYVDGANITNWPMSSDAQEFVATHNLSQAFANNKDLQVFVVSGYYDLACPMGTVEYEKSRLDPESNGRGRMTIHAYESGHMAYINPVVMHQIKQDLSAFYTLAK